MKNPKKSSIQSKKTEPVIHREGAEEFVNLGAVEGIPHIELFDMVSKVIAEDTLDHVNSISKKVVPAKSLYTDFFKRVIDIELSLCAIVVTLPVNLVLAACTFADVGRPIFFTQKRVGKNGKPFTIIKFRNMTNATDALGNLLPPDQRVTKFGRFVRRTSLDELLNFLSVFKGDMSLIGPRPLPFDYNDYYSDRHMMRYAVKPGLECPNIRLSAKMETWGDQFENDVYYVENVSFLMDIKMMFALVKLVFDRKSTNVRANAVKGSFMGYHKDGTSISSEHVEKRYYDEAVRRMGYTDQDPNTTK